MRKMIIVSLGVFFNHACGAADESFNQSTQSAIVRSVDSATNAFAQAERAKDPELVLAHIAPEFYMYNDGKRVGYDSVASQVRQTFPSLSSFETTWTDIEVQPLGRDHALVSFRFSDRIIDAAGLTINQSGPTTLIWERRGENWLIIYADSDHYPSTSQ